MALRMWLLRVSWRLLAIPVTLGQCQRQSCYRHSGTDANAYTEAPECHSYADGSSNAKIYSNTQASPDAAASPDTTRLMACPR